MQCKPPTTAISTPWFDPNKSFYSWQMFPQVIDVCNSKLTRRVGSVECTHGASQCRLLVRLRKIQTAWPGWGELVRLCLISFTCSRSIPIPKRSWCHTLFCVVPRSTGTHQHKRRERKRTGATPVFWLSAFFFLWRNSFQPFVLSIPAINYAA